MTMEYATIHTVGSGLQVYSTAYHSIFRLEMFNIQTYSPKGWPTSCLILNDLGQMFKVTQGH